VRHSLLRAKPPPTPAIAGPPQITGEPDMAALVAALAGVQALTGSPAASYLARRGIPLELAGQATIA